MLGPNGDQNSLLAPQLFRMALRETQKGPQVWYRRLGIRKKNVATPVKYIGKVFSRVCLRTIPQSNRLSVKKGDTPPGSQIDPTLNIPGTEIYSGRMFQTLNGR